MKKGRLLGLDELMIVNPGPPGAEALFLGNDGILYQIQGLGQEEVTPGMGQFYLGDDGILYQVEGLGSLERPSSTAQFFLGDDGMLYEIISD